MARENDAEVRDDELLDEGSGPRVYELGFHLDPELPSEEVKKIFAKLHDAVAAVGAVIAEGAPEKIQLAYTISRQETSGRRDFDLAYFAWIAYECDSSKHGAVLEAAKGEPRIVRFIDLLTTKEAARHAAEMRAIKEEVPAKSAQGDDAVSDAELDAALESATI